MYFLTPGLSSILEMAFMIAVLAAVLLFVGGLVSFAVYAYRSVTGEGPKDPREVDQEEEGLKEGGSDDEWEYY
ncbi:MAG: hypothetical protein PPP58_08635 [Natronomonas sp.]